MIKVDKNSQEVTAHIEKLDPSIASLVNDMRLFILSIDASISEEVKWNSPSFYYNGEMKPFNPKEYKRDILVMNLNRGKILFVFPTGAVIDDPTSILEGKYADGRRLIGIKDSSDFLSKKSALKDVILNWLSKVEK